MEQCEIIAKDLFHRHLHGLSATKHRSRCIPYIDKTPSCHNLAQHSPVFLHSKLIFLRSLPLELVWPIPSVPEAPHLHRSPRRRAGRPLDVTQLHLLRTSAPLLTMGSWPRGLRWPFTTWNPPEDGQHFFTAAGSPDANILTKKIKHGFTQISPPDWE